MDTLAVIEQSHLCPFALCRQLAEIQAIQVALYVALLIGRNDDRLGLLAETNDAHHHPFALGKLNEIGILSLLAVQTAEVQMPKAVFLTPVDILAVIPRQEGDGKQWFDIFLIALCKQRCLLLASRNVVGVKMRLVLVSVEFYKVQRLAVRTP